MNELQTTMDMHSIFTFLSISKQQNFATKKPALFYQGRGLFIG
tara:strand:- start:1 stop:129 length:129 start_codon:yes stop_codon:yes gene_type:complete